MNKFDINQLTLDEKIGQLIMFGFDALELNDHAIELITKYKAGNVILFTRNVQTPKQLFELNQNLQKLALETLHIPLFISIDQEGGMVTRIQNGATYFPGAMTIAATNKTENAYQVGDIMGKELISLGINMNLAPVFDVNNNPKNPVIGVRSYSDDPDKVAIYGTKMTKGLQNHVIATGKHFPGHGDTHVDSHLSLPVVDKEYLDIKDVELKPFKYAIDNGLEAIMSSHINYPYFTNGYPSTMSRELLTNLLRNQLEFEGLIVTDCMQMKAIQNKYSTPYAVVKTINAGSNLVCISHSYDIQTASIKEVKQAVLDGELEESIINDRVQRVLRYKEKYCKVDFNQTYDDIKEIVINKESKELSYKIVEDAATLIKGELPTIDSDTLLIANDPISTTIADDTDGILSIIGNLKKEIPSLDTLHTSIRLTEQEYELAIETSKKYKQVIYCTYNANIYQNQIKLVDYLSQHTKLTVIMMRNPYDTYFARNIENLLALYEYTPQSVNVLTNLLKGTFTPKGTLPVEL